MAMFLGGLAAIAFSLALLMGFAWVVRERTGNSGWVDTIWTFAEGLVGAGSALWPLAIEKEWRRSGTHYQRTAIDWLAKVDAHRDAIEASLRNVYGDETYLWMRRWRWFFLATAGLFGYANGTEWGVSHYRMKAAS